MRTQEPKNILLSEYQAPLWTVESTYLDFILNDDETLVTATTQYEATDSNSDTLFLHGESLELMLLEVNGQAFTNYQQDDQGLTLSQLPARCEIKITTRIYPQKNTSLEGLYQSSGNYCTQCEAEGFRKITYFQDRPDVMTVYTTRIEADKKTIPVLLSNGNLIESGDVGSDRHFAVWQDPHRKPAYLFALVAGDLACVDDSFTTMSGREVDLKIYTEPHNIVFCDYAMESLKRSMTWDEERFGLEYDLDIYMIVAVDDFNMGAMENKGLNVFNSRLVFASPETATDKQYIDIEAVIGHEYFHNWTGNRVTCRDWFQLSLKEGLTVFRDQEFTADLHSRPVKRIEDVRFLRAMQFEEDAGPMSHPIRPNAYIEINNFYTLTVYEKGAEVVRLYHTLLGEEGFRKGMDLYFQRHDGQAVTTEDFLASMEDANDADLSQLQVWYDQAGTPELTVSMDYSAEQQTCTLNIKQQCAAHVANEDCKPYLIPLKMGLVGQAGDLPLKLQGESGDATSSCLLQVTETEQSFTFEQVKERPVPSLLRGFSAPVKLDYNYSDDDYIFLMANDSDAFNRWEAAQQLAMNTMLGFLEEYKHGRAYGLSHEFITAFQRVLTDESLDCALRAEALMLPSYALLADAVGEEVDPEAIIFVVDFVNTTLANALRVDFEALYERLNQGSYALDGKSMAERSLKNVCLAYLSKVDDELIEEVLVAQFKQADNMTDAVQALSLLINSQADYAEQAVADYYNQWQDNAQVMDQWFMVQASAKTPDVLERVEALFKHPKFVLTNPNKVRSLVGAFSRNYQGFHREDGAGYAFLADIVSALDEMNPQIASRLVKPLISWKSLESKRSGLMKAQLERLNNKQNLSKDVYEIVTKALV